MTSDTQLYVSEISVALYGCLLFITLFKNGKKNFFSSINFTIISYMLHSISGYFSYYIDFNHSSVPLQYLCSTVYAFAGFIALFFYGRFFVETSEFPTREKKIISMFNAAFLVLNFAMNVPHIFSGGFFYVTEDCVYMRGDLFYLSYIFVFIELITLSVFALIFIKNKMKVIGHICFGILPVIYSVLVCFLPITSAFFDIITGLSFIILYFFVYIGEREIALENETKLAKYKTDIMLSQIGPHFIYNTLSTISALCTIDPKKAQDLSADFTDYLRENLNLAKSERLSTFEDELNHTKKYIEIEKVRFGKKINVEYDIKEKNFMLPSLSLQPIVENAVKHGITKKKEGGTVKISTKADNDYYIVTVEDNGLGFDSDNFTPEENHYGIINTKERLKIMFNGEMKIESKIGEGTTVKIIVPKEVKRGKTV